MGLHVQFRHGQESNTILRCLTRAWRAAPAITTGAVLAGCSALMPASPSEPFSLADFPESFTTSEDANPHQPLAWWESFADPALNRIVEKALTSNLDLRQAVARIEQARARARIARAAFFPLVKPSISAVDFETPTNAGIGAQLDELGLGSELIEDLGFALPDSLQLRTYSLSTEFAYEADFWGRNRKDALAAGAEHLASEADYLTARISILAETIGAYLEVVDSRSQERFAIDMIAILEQRASLIENRYERGLINVLPVYSLQRQLREARVELPRIEAATADAEARLWVLLGGYSEALSSLLPDEPAPSMRPQSVPIGIPADLLTQRPDIAAAQQRMQAARFALGARRADLLPSLSLSGVIGLQSTDSNELFDPDQWFHNLGLNLLGPTVQGASRRAKVELAEARLREATATYGRSVVAAVNEVQAALTGLEASRSRHALLSSHLEEAKAEASLQEQRYTSGVGDYEELLAANQLLVSARSAFSAAERELGVSRLALHRSLGGAWTRESLINSTSART